MSEEEICELYLNPDKGNNYISKDKIKEKIKELENKVSNENYWKLTETQFIECMYGIELLKELLKEQL